MEVSAASSSSTPSCVRDRNTGVPPASTTTPASAQVQEKVLSSSCLFLNDDEGKKEEEQEEGDGKIMDKLISFHGSNDSSQSSSSIGVPGDFEDENDDDDEVSSFEVEESRRTKFSMDLFGDNLPIKRGLSSHYRGKSKSFGNLSEVTTLKDIEKEENPFNKRRRVLTASKLRSTNSFYSRPYPKSMPLLPILLDEEDDEEDVFDEDEDQYQAKH